MACKACHKPKLVKVQFEIGERYIINGHEYILAQVEGVFDPSCGAMISRWALICLMSGNRWNEPCTDITDVFRDSEQSTIRAK